jgi:hypothetical protein
MCSLLHGSLYRLCGALRNACRFLQAETANSGKTGPFPGRYAHCMVKSQVFRRRRLAMLFNRFDGTRAKNVPAYRRLIPFLMRGRNESAVYFEQTVDLSQTLAWLERFNAGRQQRITVFHLLLGAFARTLAERPRLNRFVSGRRIWDRKGIWLSFAAKKRMDDRAPLSTVKLELDPEQPFPQMVERIHGNIDRARSARKSAAERDTGLLLRLPALFIEIIVRLVALLDFFNLAPRSLLEHDPMYTSVFVANLGSLGLDAAFHHLYEHGNCPLFVTVGRMERVPTVEEDGTVAVKTLMRLRYVYDERVEDGLYCGRALQALQERMENPACWAGDLANDAVVRGIDRAEAALRV